MAIGTNSSATSERKTTPVNTSREIAASSLDRVGDARAEELGIRKEVATLTGHKVGCQWKVIHGNATHAPGNSANMFGSVLPIQNKT